MNKNVENTVTEHLSMDQWEQMGRSGETVEATVNTRGISMWPLLRCSGDSVRIIYPNRPLRVGDIVMFHSADGRELAHRICWLDGTLVQTIGDNCNRPDGRIDKTKVIGLVTQVCRKGKLFRVDTKFWYYYGRFMMWSNPVRMFIRDKIYRPIRKFLRKLIKGH